MSEKKKKRKNSDFLSSDMKKRGGAEKKRGPGHQVDQVELTNTGEEKEEDHSYSNFCQVVKRGRDTLPIAKGKPRWRIPLSTE